MGKKAWEKVDSMWETIAFLASKKSWWRNVAMVEAAVIAGLIAKYTNFFESLLRKVL